jgi:hypothetical protein
MSTSRPLLAALLAAALLPAGRGAAQDRPSEAEIFGSPPAAAPSPPEPAPEKPAPQAEPRPSEQELFGGGSTAPNAQPPPPVGIISGEREDPLKIGGQIYLRLQSQWLEGVQPRDWFLSSPNLVDLFADVRPNDRVRGFVLGRMSYDPTLAPGQSASLFGQPGLTLPSVSASSAANPRAVLDQLWLNFDVLDRRAFLTAGRQHVKWGVGKFWNPTDYLHPVKRDPLAVFDARVGTTMLKLHVPWEKRGWNLYGIGLFEDVAGQPRGTNRVGRIGAGGRAEIVLGTAELGLDALVQDGHQPRFGVDVSGGVGDLDLYAEAALRQGIDGSRWRIGASPTDLADYTRDDPTGFTPQVTLGGSWSAKYSDEDSVTLGAEYFYNDAGYTDAHIYPFLLAGAPEKIPPIPPSTTPTFISRDPFAFRPFYLGKHYAGAYASLPSPGSWNNTTFTLSVLGNLSDQSFIARLDHSVLLLTYLRIETFVAGHFGTKGGEFRLGFDVPASLTGTPIHVPAPVLDLGVAARVSL